MKKISIGGLVLGSLLLTACGQAAALKDGIYSHKQDYSIDKYNSYINVNTTLKDGKILEVDVIGDPNGPTTLKYVTEFKKSIQEKLVGKTLDEAKKMGYVSGASSVSKAFSDALTAIEKEASATK